MNDKDRQTIERCLQLCSSSVDAEALAALRMAQTILERNKVKWFDFIKGIGGAEESPTRVAPGVWRSASSSFAGYDEALKKRAQKPNATQQKYTWNGGVYADGPAQQQQSYCGTVKDDFIKSAMNDLEQKANKAYAAAESERQFREQQAAQETEAERKAKEDIVGQPEEVFDSEEEDDTIEWG